MLLRAIAPRQSLASPIRQTDLRLRAAFGSKDPHAALKLLCDKGILTLETSAARGVGDKTEQVATLAVPAQDALDQAAARRRTAPLQYAVVELLCSIGAASTKELCYFTGASSATLRALAKRGLLTLERQEVFRRVSIPEGVEPVGEPQLNEEQLDGVYDRLSEHMTIVEEPELRLDLFRETLDGLFNDWDGVRWPAGMLETFTNM